MTNWRDPKPEDYRLPSRENMEVSDSNNKITIHKIRRNIFRASQAFLIALFCLYLLASIHSIKSFMARVEETSEVSIIYPEIRNPNNLSQEEIQSLISFYRMDRRTNSANRPKISNEDILELIGKNNSKNEVELKLKILNVILYESESGSIEVEGKDELSEIMNESISILEKHRRN